MFIPVYTDRELRRRALVTYSLMFLSTVVFVWFSIEIQRLQFDLIKISQAGLKVSFETILSKYPIYGHYLQPLGDGNGYDYSQLFSYQFLHLSWEHLIGNMVFLMVFGPSVEDRLGRFWFLLFYLLGGTAAGLGHIYGGEMTPTLGASGSVAAVTGAYLALAPRSYVTIAYWFLRVRTFEVISFTVIGLQIAKDFLYQVSGMDGVANLAHLAGYSYGFGVAMLLLWWRVLEREPFDMLTWIDRRRKRLAFRSLARRGEGSWRKQSGGKLSEEEIKISDLRCDIQSAFEADDLNEAMAGYEALLEVDGGQVLDEGEQFRIASQYLMQEQYTKAAAGFECYLEAYVEGENREEARLNLGVIYGRHLNRKGRAVELLEGLENELAVVVLGELKG